MNDKATAVADFRKGSTPLFFASDGWENGDPFDCGWYASNTSLNEGFLKLTKSGRKIAEGVYERHTLFSQILTDLGVDPKIAAEDACRIEHVISQESFDAIKKRIKKD